MPWYTHNYNIVEKSAAGRKGFGILKLGFLKVFVKNAIYVHLTQCRSHLN